MPITNPTQADARNKAASLFLFNNKTVSSTGVIEQSKIQKITFQQSDYPTGKPLRQATDQPIDTLTL